MVLKTAVPVSIWMVAEVIILSPAPAKYFCTLHIRNDDQGMFLSVYTANNKGKYFYIGRNEEEVRERN